jgi:hypothetical protein
MRRTYRPIDPGQLPLLLAHTVMRTAAAQQRRAPLRVAVDGPDAAGPLTLAKSLVDPLRARGQDAVVIDARTFWRDASLRLEFGREDVESFAGWLDDGALRREVLDAVRTSPQSTGPATVLPALRDPQTNRSLRLPRRAVSPAGVVLVAGPLLLGRGLPFDMTIHLALTPGARARRTEAQWQWTLPAFDRYDDEVTPADVADVVLRMDDPRHPAIG